MFWFERKAEEIENPKQFIVDVLHKFVKAEPWEGGGELGDYIAEIENDKIKSKFLYAIEILIKSKDTEDWIKEELEVAKKAIASKKREAVVYRTASAG